MRQRLAETLDVPLGAVSVKAKTGEGVDAVGRGRGDCGARGCHADSQGPWVLIFGLRPAVEALRAGRVTELAVSTDRQRGLAQLLELAERRRVRLQRVERAELDRRSGGAVHQGVVATVRPLATYGVADLIAVHTPPLIVALDGIEDPRNLGAIARTVDAAGASGLIVPERRAAPVTGAAVKASAGALVHVPLAPVVNLARALEELKAAGVWTIGLDAEADRSLYALDPASADSVRWSAARAAASIGWWESGATGASRCRCRGRWRV